MRKCWKEYISTGIIFVYIFVCSNRIMVFDILWQRWKSEGSSCCGFRLTILVLLNYHPLLLLFHIFTLIFTFYIDFHILLKISHSSVLISSSSVLQIKWQAGLINRMVWNGPIFKKYAVSTRSHDKIIFWLWSCVENHCKRIQITRSYI